MTLLWRRPVWIVTALIGILVGTAGIDAVLAQPGAGNTVAVPVDAPMARSTVTAAPAVTTSTSTSTPTTTTTEAAAFTPPVEADVEPPPAPALSAERRSDLALGLLDYRWERLGYSVTFEDAKRGLLGKTNCDTKQVFIFMRPSQTIEQIAFVTAFELGHAIDCGTMTSARRAEWARIRGFAEGWQWFPGCLCTEDNYGSGDLSMVFATWLVPHGGYGWRSNLAGPPSPEMLDQLMPYLRPSQVA